MRNISRSRGSAAIDVVIYAAVLVFMLLPLFTAVVEKYIIQNEIQIIRDASDITNISVYNAMNSAQLGKARITFDTDEAVSTYKKLLQKNLKLDGMLEPLTGSIAQETVSIESLEFYTVGFPVKCPLGKEIGRPAVHSCIRVPVKPSLYRQAILSLTGKSSFELRVHVDTDLPVNN